MVSLIPLALGIIGAALAFAVVIFLKIRREPSARRHVVVAISVSIAALVGSYISFALIDGDPDVWDFYASVWWLPLLVGVIFALGVITILRRRKRGLLAANR